MEKLPAPSLVADLVLFAEAGLHDLRKAPAAIGRHLRQEPKLLDEPVADPVDGCAAFRVGQFIQRLFRIPRGLNRLERRLLVESPRDRDPADVHAPRPSLGQQPPELDVGDERGIPEARRDQQQAGTGGLQRPIDVLPPVLSDGDVPISPQADAAAPDGGLEHQSEVVPPWGAVGMCVAEKDLMASRHGGLTCVLREGRSSGWMTARGASGLEADGHRRHFNAASSSMPAVRAPGDRRGRRSLGTISKPGSRTPSSDTSWHLEHPDRCPRSSIGLHPAGAVAAQR